MSKLLLPISIVLTLVACKNTGVRTPDGGSDSGTPLVVEGDEGDVIEGDEVTQNVNENANCPLVFTNTQLTQSGTVPVGIDYSGADLEVCPDLTLTGVIVNGSTDDDGNPMWTVDSDVNGDVLGPGGLATIVVSLDAGDSASAWAVLQVAGSVTVGLIANIADTGGSSDTGGGGTPLTWYVDADLDGYGDPSTAVTTTDGAPTDGSTYVLTSGDCDDTEPAAHPGGTEVCDGIDNDCDGDVDEGELLEWFVDGDGDGYGDDGTMVESCDDPGGYVLTGGDCDDTEGAANPGASETCDEIDNDCDGLVDADDSDVADAYTQYLDADEDGHGDSSSVIVDCEQLEGYSLVDGDCDDADGDVYPGADEVCNEIDDDCDGDIDDDDAGIADATTWYADVDGDGYGDPSTTMETCEQPSGYVEYQDDQDCNDGDEEIFPGAEEYCSGADEDCDGDVDENTGTISVTIDAAGGSCSNPYGAEAGNTWSGTWDSCSYAYFACDDEDAEVIATSGQIVEDENCALASVDGWEGGGDSDGDVCFIVYLPNYPSSYLPADGEEAYDWYFGGDTGS